ncbi:MAG TPA: aminotransferase class IV [Fimbriiglobus sp.]|jgi:branched-chain amino acid aminotransferase|nr:aminotransferase class IV [Fimbriiglobus sp.]
MPSKVWIDGKLVDKNDARISVFDHGLLFGDGVWEGMRAYDGHVFKLREHIDWLYHTAETLSLKIPLTSAELIDAVVATLKANSRTNGYVRVIVTRGPGTLGLDPRKCEPAVIVIAEDVVEYPRELYDAGLDVVMVAADRYESSDRTLSRAGVVQARVEALKAGCLDAILYRPGGTIHGSTDGSVFAVKDGQLTGTALTQVAQAVVVAEAKAAGLSVAGELTQDHLLSAPDEIFLVSTAAEVIAVRSIDGKPVGSGKEGPITRKLRELYRTAARRPPV